MAMKIDGKDCADYGLRLISARITAPEKKTSWVDIPGGDGEVDLLAGIGPTRYKMRTVSLVFEAAGLDPLDAGKSLQQLWESETITMELPGYEGYTITGVAHVDSFGRKAEDPICVAALCQPWFLAKAETVTTVAGAPAGTAATLQNGGKREAVPELEVTETARIVYAGSSTNLTPGKYLMPEYMIPGQDSISLTVYDGAVTFRYREAVL